MSNALTLVLIASCFSVTGEVLLKSGMDRVGVLSFTSLGSTAIKMLHTWHLWAGFGSIGIGAVFWLAAISRVDLSWAYPMLATGYILVLIFSAIVLHEHVSHIRWLGAIVIVLGIYLISRS